MQDKGGQTDRLSFTSGELSIISHITCFVSKVEVSGEKKRLKCLCAVVMYAVTLLRFMAIDIAVT